MYNKFEEKCTWQGAPRAAARRGAVDVVVGGGAVLDEVVAPQDQGGGEEELFCGGGGVGVGSGDFGSGVDLIPPVFMGKRPRSRVQTWIYTMYTYLEEEEERGKRAGGPVRAAVGAGVALDVVEAGAAPGELAPEDGRHEREEGDHHRHAQHEADL